MQSTVLEVQTRDKQVKAKDLLVQNLIPLEYYGKGVENKSLQVDYQTFRKAYKQAGESTVVELNIDGKEKANVLIHDVQFNPVSDKIVHVDLINVRMDEAIHTHIPLKFVGTSLAVKDHSGMLSTPIHSIEVKCLPKDLVHEIEVSIESLVDFQAHITIKDIKLPDTIQVLNKPDDVVAMAIPPRVEEETSTETPPASEVPVEGEEKKAAEEGGEAATDAEK